MADSQVNIARCPRSLNAEFHCISAFQQPRCIGFMEQTAKQPVKSRLSAHTLEVAATTPHCGH